MYCSDFSVLVLILGDPRPDAERTFLGSFLLFMAIAVNVVLVFVAPEQFVALGVAEAILAMYQWFFENVVASAPRVFGLFPACYEITVGLLILRNGTSVKVGLVGGVAFLVAITSLGILTLTTAILTPLQANEWRRRNPPSGG